MSLRRGNEVVKSWVMWPNTMGKSRPLQLLPDKYEVQIREGSKVLRSYTIDARKPGAKIIVP